MSEVVESDVVPQGHDNILNRNIASSSRVEDFESVEEVEIWFQGYFDLGTL